MNVPTIGELWWSNDSGLWDEALERYWSSGLLKRANIELERQMEKLDLAEIRALDARDWYGFLRDRYFRWKYTAPNRYATTTKALERCLRENRLHELHEIKERLLSLDLSDVRRGLELALEIEGLGTAGASGLLALFYPQVYGTVDQFVVKALREIPNLPERERLKKTNPDSLKIADAMVLIRVMQEKAAENDRQFGTDTWTPRKIDKVLWTYPGKVPQC